VGNGVTRSLARATLGCCPILGHFTHLDENQSERLIAISVIRATTMILIASRKFTKGAWQCAMQLPDSGVPPRQWAAALRAPTVNSQYDVTSEVLSEERSIDLV
jgi:hypothetical protein